MASDDDEDVPCPEKIQNEPAAVENVVVGLALPMKRYHLRASTLCGEEDVEQFIAEFSDVAVICSWPVGITLIR